MISLELLKTKPNKPSVPLMDDWITEHRWSDLWFQWDNPPEHGWWPSYAADSTIPGISLRYWNGEFWSEGVGPNHSQDFVLEKKSLKTRFKVVLWAKRGPKWLDPERVRTEEVHGQ